MVRAMVLSAGLGTRLRPLTTELPKALVPIGDRPLAAHIAQRLFEASFSEIVMNTHHLSEIFPTEVNGFPVKVHLIHEAEIRGTAGGIAGARGLLRPAPIVVWNADILADPPIHELLAGATPGVLCLAVAERPCSEGTLGLDANGRVVRLRGRTFGVEASGGDYIGVAALGREVLEALPAKGCLIGDVAIPRLARGELVTAVKTEAPWRDVGSLSEYLAANFEWLRAAHGPCASWVHPTARVSASVRLDRCIVGAGAVVSGSGVVARSVVWPRAQAHAPLANAVVTQFGVAQTWPAVPPGVT